jgi:putative phosphoesterase
MRILALYDIHGNAEALDAVLADPRAADSDAVVVGGDVVPGPFVAQVLDRLERLTVPVHWVRGNGEREVAEAAAAGGPTDDTLPARCAAANAAALGGPRSGQLAAWPFTVELDGVLYCHASPRRDDEILTRISATERWTDALAGVRTGLVVAGHTHQQDDRRVGGVRFVNAGSVGLPYEGDGAARWLWVDDGEPALRATAFDAGAAGARMLAAGWPDEESVRAALVEPGEPLEITRIFEDIAVASAD